jgi:hypothetical protein
VSATSLAVGMPAVQATGIVRCSLGGGRIPSSNLTARGTPHNDTRPAMMRYGGVPGLVVCAWCVLRMAS